MIEIRAGVIKTSGIVIPEIVYLRTEQNTRLGEITPEGLVRVWTGYGAWLKSRYDAEGQTAPKIVIDDLIQGTVIGVNPQTEITARTFGQLHVDYNTVYIEVLKEQLGLTDADVKIIDM